MNELMNDKGRYRAARAAKKLASVASVLYVYFQVKNIGKTSNIGQYWARLGKIDNAGNIGKTPEALSLSSRTKAVPPR